MKSLKFFVVALFVSLSFFACKKSSTESPAPTATTVEGIWVGKFGTGNNNPSSFFSLNFKAGGVIEELTETGEIKGKGTWKIDNKIITATYKYVSPAATKFSIIGSLNGNVGKILGNWGYNDSVTDGGLWEMTKKN